MEGKCPGCSRVYDISEEFLSMGGRAKCPHCLVELDFATVGARPERDPRRDLTKPDASQRPVPTYEQQGHQEPDDEIDAGCPGCRRRFKVDREYLNMGGQAQCPHCGDDLVFDDQGAAAADVENSLDQAAQDHAADDLFADSGELSLPELDKFRVQGSAEDSGIDFEEAVDEGTKQDDDFELEPTASIQPGGSGPGGIPDLEPPLDPDDDLDDEVPTQLLDRVDIPDAAPGDEEVSREGDIFPGEPMPDAWDPFSQAEEHGGVRQEFPAEFDPDEPIVGKLEELPPDDAGPPVVGELVEGSPEAGDEGSHPAATQTDDLFEGERQSEEDLVFGDVSSEAPADPAGNADAGESMPAGGVDPGLFTGLASSKDWASAAAQWAESGFKSEAMPSFIKTQPPEEAGAPESALEQGAESPEAVGGEVLFGQEAEAVEVSDADILILDEEEAGVDEEASSIPDATWAERASEEIQVRVPVAKKPRPAAKSSSRLKSPPVLAGILGGVVLVAAVVVYILMSKSVDIKDVAFSTEGLQVSVVDAPAPAGYEAKEDARKHYGRGNQLAFEKKFEDAIEEYKKALRSDPRYPHPNRALGAVYAALGKPGLSASYYEAYLRLTPNGADADQVRKVIRTQRDR